MDRRTFLGVGFGAGTVFGLERLLAHASQDPAQDDSRDNSRDNSQDKAAGVPERAKPLEAALREMARSGRGGLLFLVPEDEKQRRRLGQFLYEIATLDVPLYARSEIDGGDRRRIAVGKQASGSDDEFKRFVAGWRRDACDVRAAVVLICLTANEAKRAFGGPENRILLDARGREIARRRADDSKLEPGPLHELVQLVRGDNDLHLERIAHSTLLDLEAETRTSLKASLATIRGTTQGPRLAAAVATIEEHANALRAFALLAAGAAKDDGARDRLAGMVQKLATGGEPQLPYGTRMPRFHSMGCGSFDELPEGAEPPKVMIACGMALPTPEGRRYVRFAKS